MRTGLAVPAVGMLAVLTLAGAGRGDEKSPYQPPKDYKDFDLKVLGVGFVEPRKDEKTGFVVGGKNATALIRKLTEINGRPIADLEKTMRPGAEGEEGSVAGFLGREERLLDVLAADNDTVLNELKLTHQELARHLIVLGALGDWEMGRYYERLRKEGKRPTKEEFEKGLPTFTYHGRRFKVEVVYYKGFQESPFQDNTRTSTDATVHNLDTGKKLWYSRLIPLMIERYGFYEGTGTRYRVDPKEVVEVLDFLKKDIK